MGQLRLSLACGTDLVVQDVKFGSTNMPAMSFIGGGATTYQQWFDFLGLLKDKRCALTCSV